MAATGVTIVKRFEYRGDANEEYSNTYWTNRDTPADSAAWAAFVGGLAILESECYGPEVEIIRAYGYDDDAENATAVYVRDFTEVGDSIQEGQLSLTGLEACPGDAAATVRWKTTRVGSTGKPIYLRKFFHPAYRVQDVTDPDALAPAQLAAIQAFAEELIDSPTKPWHLVARGHSDEDQPTAALANDTVTYRQLKRRGKRPGA